MKDALKAHRIPFQIIALLLQTFYIIKLAENALRAEGEDAWFGFLFTLFIVIAPARPFRSLTLCFWWSQGTTHTALSIRRCLSSTPYSFWRSIFMIPWGRSSGCCFTPRFIFSASWTSYLILRIFALRHDRCLRCPSHRLWYTAIP